MLTRFCRFRQVLFTHKLCATGPNSSMQSNRSLAMKGALSRGIDWAGHSMCSLFARLVLFSLSGPSAATHAQTSITEASFSILCTRKLLAQSRSTKSCNSDLVGRHSNFDLVTSKALQLDMHDDMTKGRPTQKIQQYIYNDTKTIKPPPRSLQGLLECNRPDFGLSNHTCYLYAWRNKPVSLRAQQELIVVC